jgi:hypothetical protein
MMTDEPFDEDSLIYTYSRALFSETVQSALNRDLWVDTHERIYKYIRERNALKIFQLESGDMGAQPGHFSFEADDDLVDSIFNVELTLKVFVPESWTGDTVTVGPEGEYIFVKVQEDSLGPYILYDWLPTNGVTIAVHEGIHTGTGFQDSFARSEELSLVAAPNPFLHETRITVTGNGSTDAYLIIMDIHGRIVQEIREHTGATYHLPRADLSPGIYIIQLIDSGKQFASLKIMAL